jgi:hypothetical protein
MQKPWNRWHLREYGVATLTTLVSVDFDLAELFEMSARRDVAEVELSRYRRLKWLALPFTFPFIPETWRKSGLNWVHRLQPRPRVNNAEQPTYAFGEEVVEFLDSSPHSLNLVMVAYSRRHSENSQCSSRADAGI